MLENRYRDTVDIRTIIIENWVQLLKYRNCVTRYNSYRHELCTLRYARGSGII